MKNIFLPLILFLIMISTMIYSIFFLSSTCTSMSITNSNLEKFVIEEKWDEANTTVEKLMTEWNAHSNKICIFVHHREIDNIHNEISKLTQYVNYHNKDESMASIYAIKFLFEHILNLEKINIQNVF